MNSFSALNSLRTARKSAGPFSGSLQDSVDTNNTQVGPPLAALRPKFVTEQDISGVIYSPEAQNLNIRKLGQTNVAVLTFEGRKVTRHIFYWNEAIPVRLYRKTTPACPRCGAVGHRADVCPTPNAQRGQACGEAQPGLEHNCTPTCLICGDSHLTGSADCAAKFRHRRPGTVRNSGTNKNTNPRGAGNDQPSGAERQLQHQRKGDGEDPGNQGRRHTETATNPPAADHTKVSSWAWVASFPPPSLAIQALKAENIQLKQELEQLRQEIRTIKAERSLVTPAPPQDGDAGSEEPMIQTADPEYRQQVEHTPLENQGVRALFERKHTV
ncbi:hypothetical protein HPB48_001339 [Haemaphysalis longicornis]|uniref:CCHC-type domain-containing protein n=1 Tax=Haemaphysalis longicornis TaxID=44386 RepID=A0A9J6GXJ3_HAELO|nr:hypothetical protein HPB48_001339 [Haemaphysalis longicornis]